jgi:hypothetical protein
MTAQCIESSFQFQPLGNRDVVARFDGGDITSDAGGLLLRKVEQRTGIVRQFAACFQDRRKPELIEHTVKELVAQRVYGLALGYEDLNDHDQLRADPLLAMLAGKSDPKGECRLHERDRGKALAGKSTLNRLERTPENATAKQARYKKIVLDMEAADQLLVDLFFQAHARAPEHIVLDLDATDDRIHGNQEGRFYHGYYGEYCYLPLYIFCGEFLLCARLRKSDTDASAGTVNELKRIIGQIRRVWPRVPILIRGDSGFCRDEIMSWCEEQQLDYVFGLAKNDRLKADIAIEQAAAAAEYEQTKKAARVFKDFRYRTRDSWTRERRGPKGTPGKAEHLDKGANPRFVVTSIAPEGMDARALYEDLYCARGEMENRIKEQQLDLFADRTSTAEMRSNQIRLYFSSIAYVFMQALRRLGLKGTEMEKAQCGTIRLKLLKIGAQIRVTVRKVWISLAQGYAYASVFAQVFANLEEAEVPSG